MINKLSLRAVSNYSLKGLFNIRSACDLYTDYNYLDFGVCEECARRPNKKKKQSWVKQVNWKLWLGLVLGFGLYTILLIIVNKIWI